MSILLNEHNDRFYRKICSDIIRAKFGYIPQNIHRLLFPLNGGSKNVKEVLVSLEKALIVEPLLAYNLALIATIETLFNIGEKVKILKSNSDKNLLNAYMAVFYSLEFYKIVTLQNNIDIMKFAFSSAYSHIVQVTKQNPGELTPLYMFKILCEYNLGYFRVPYIFLEDFRKANDKSEVNALFVAQHE